ncbi:hypothetical protein D3C71_1791610 [compost metagenome]
MTDSLPCLGERFGGRDFFLAGLRAKPPEIEQRLDRQIEGAFTLHRQILANANQLKDWHRHRLTTVGG